MERNSIQAFIIKTTRKLMAFIVLILQFNFGQMTLKSFQEF